jgi:hypothetical protein
MRNLSQARMTPAREGIFATRLKDKQWADDFETALDWITNAPAAAHYRATTTAVVRRPDFMLQNGKATSLAEKATANPAGAARACHASDTTGRSAQVEEGPHRHTPARSSRMPSARSPSSSPKLKQSNMPIQFEDAERGVRKAQEALDAELGGPGDENAATGLES